MNKKIKRYAAALSIVWAQVAFTGAIAADEADNAQSIEPDNTSSITVPAASNRALLDDEISSVTIKTKKEKKLSELLEEFNTAASITGLCIGSSIDELLEEIQKSENISKSDAAIIIINTLSGPQIRSLPTKAKTGLIAAIDNHTMDADKFYALKKLYTNAVEDPAFYLWDAEKQLELSKAVRDNPVLQKARKDWDIISDQEKLNAMRVAADLTIQIYGADIGAKTVPLDYMQYQEENIYGMYIPSARAMFLNLKSPKVPEDFKETVSVTIHEALHAYHHQLIDKLEAGTLDKDHPSYKYAELMKESYTRYISDGQDYIAYVSNPTERHAWEITYIGSYAGTGPSVSLQRQENKVKSARSIYDQFKQERQQLKEKVANDNTTCGPVSIEIPRWNP